VKAKRAAASKRKKALQFRFRDLPMACSLCV
jgi:hypothetical protein